jgi:hypothetical protein
MNENHKISERGQAIVYLVLGIVVFFGFVAMAIDGGMVLADRRHEQNAADAASLAGGGKVAADFELHYVNSKNWDCSSYDWAKNNAEFTAQERAKANGFDITYVENSDAAGSDTNYALATCANKYFDVTVDISATTQSNFLQIIYPEALHNEVTAVTRVFPRRPIAPGDAIIALNSEACSGNQNGDIFYINSKDSATLYVYNGSIHSNGCIKCNGSPNIRVECDPADPNCSLGSFGDFPPETCNGTWDPAPTYPVDQIDPELFSDIIPDCSLPNAHIYTGADFEKLMKNNKLYTMASGLWCIDGNVTINANKILAGTDVTIYMRNGDFTINGTPQINLTASSDTHASPQIPGVLIYVAPPSPFDASKCTNHVVKLNGTESSTFVGSVVAPCSQVSLTGTGGNTYRGQIVGWNVEVGGDANLKLTYDESLIASSPTKIELHK